MKTLTILGMLLMIAGCDGGDAPMEGIGGAQVQAGTGGMAAPEVPCDSQYGEVGTAFNCRKTSPGGNPCAICTAAANSAQFSGGCIDTNGAAVQHFYCSVGACEDCH